jgi:poly-gamma-glutamate capsule biosynthesis protein CapA/YwtB (metallophosphatase superfamily)
MPPADHPDASAVRRAPAPSPADDPGTSRGRPASLGASRLVVLTLAVLFLIGAAAFLARALDAIEGIGASPSPGSSASLEAGAGVALADPTTIARTAVLDASAVSAGPSRVPTSAAPSVLPPCLSPVPSAQPSAAPSVASGVPGQSPGLPAEPSPDASVAPAGSVAPAQLVICANPSPAQLALRDMPFVPVVRFWETRETISRDALVQALRGRAAGWDHVLIPDGDREALEAALDITIPRAVHEADPSAIIAAVKKGDTLGILRASDVRPSVRALGIDGKELLGNDRVTRLSGWPLVAQVPVADDARWRQDATWTLVAGGDSFTDRGIYERVARRGKGVDYPLNGGTARVTGHHICPSCPRAEGNSVPIYTLSGPKGIVRKLVRDADLAIANHEQPTVSNWTYHTDGTTFSGKPDLTRIFTRAGLDFMSIANNHIHDYGGPGVLSTVKVLDDYGIKHAGAGKDLQAAAKPAYLHVNGVTVGIVSCDLIAVGHVAATRSSPGALPCKSAQAFDAISKARQRADVLIVFPHWGIEFSRERMRSQEQLAARWERMGVDLVVGAHSHIPGGIGDIEGMPVFYSMGNFIFDQNWSTATMEGILAEMTFEGDRLVQIRVHPFLTHDQSQPNLLDPRRDDGKALMKAIRTASRDISDW